MSLKTLAEPPAPTANEVWDLAWQSRLNVWYVMPGETVITWYVDGDDSLKPRSFHLTGQYYHTPQGLGIKRRYWYGFRYLSVVGRQAFETTVDPSILLKLKTKLDARKEANFKVYSRNVLRKTEKENGAIQLLDA